MRKFKTVEELEQERKEALGLIPLKMPTDKLLIAYARQSTKGQVLKNKESALSQTTEQLERGRELGWTDEFTVLLIENQAKDGTIRNASGRLRIDEREGLSTVIYYVLNDLAGAVMARDVARFFRDEELVQAATFAKTCRDHRVLVITDDYLYDFTHPTRGKSDYKKFIQEAQVAADYLTNHVKNVMHKHKERKAQRGEFIGHSIPTGYMLDETRTFYVPNPYHDELIRKLFKRFRALGGNIGSLRREIVGKLIFPDLPPDILARVGKVPLTKVPGGWTIKSRAGLAYLLTNPAYIGHVYHKGRIVKKNAHPAIVDEEDFWFAYYRLASIDFDGNPIERPEGVTKRYRQADSLYGKGADLALFSGLRTNGTPLIVTNASSKSGVYAINFPDAVRYLVEDRIEVAARFDKIAINSSTIDGIFSERLHSRVREVLYNIGEYPLDEEDMEGLESKRREINTHLLTTLEEIEKEPEEKRSDPSENLRNAIQETKIAIAEKERVSEHGTRSMHPVDIERHFASLAKLRRSLDEMEKKLERAETEEQDREQVMQKLPEVYEKWGKMDIEEKRRFIRVATTRISLDKLATGWLKFIIEWSPVLGGNLVDEAYIWKVQGGTDWTMEEEQTVREHYLTTSRQWLMQQLPERTWQGIASRGQAIHRKARKPFPFAPPAPGFPTDSYLSRKISLNDWQVIQSNELPLDVIFKERVFWREYIGKEQIDLSSANNREVLH